MSNKVTMYASALYGGLIKEGSFSKAVIAEFAQVLVSEGNSGLAGSIERAFESIHFQKNGKVGASIESAEVVAGKVLSSPIGGKDVEERVSVNPALVSGVRIRLGDAYVDNTIARRIQDLKTALK